MDLALTEDQTLIAKTAREFAQKEILPIAAALDREHRFPKEIVAKMGELGLLGIMVPEAYGGAGLDAVAYVLVLEEIAAACASTAVIMSVQNSLVNQAILNYGTDAQKQRYLPQLAKGKLLGCFALSEPGAGSDAAAQQSTARLEGDTWIISGTKNFVTNGPVAGVCVLFAMTDAAKGNKGISAFLLPLPNGASAGPGKTDKGAEGAQKKDGGIVLGPPDDKLGICASPSCQIFLSECRLPKDALLGEVNGGFKIAMSTLDGGRIGIAAQATGILRACLEDATQYAKERTTFGKPIGQHQAVGFKLADMAAELDASRYLTLAAASKKDSGARYTLEASMAKLFASEAANRAAKECVQIFGGYGYLKDYPAERHFRDAKITEIYEGTSEIQRLVIADSIIKAMGGA